MESRNLRGFKRQPRHSSNYNFFAGHPTQGGHVRPEMGRFHTPPLYPGHFLHPHPPLYHPPDMHEAIQRDIEKQRIREEIIMAEIARRRELEEEVRAELMLERGLASRTGNPFLLSPVDFGHSSMRLPLPGVRRPEGMTSLEERMKSSIEDRERGSGFEPVPFQSGTGDLRVSGLEPVSGGGKAKKKIILLPKPDANMSGLKRKAETPSGGDASELPPGFIIKKKLREWNCELCQVNVTSEIGLSEHFRGKKHKAKEAATKNHKAGKNYSIGLIQKKATESLQIVETVAPITEDGLTKAAAESSKNELDVVKEVQERGNHKENTFKFWCELCGVRAPCKSTMNKHKRGKRHVRRLANQQVKVIVHVNQAEEVDGGQEISENVDKMTLDGESFGDHEHVDPIEPRDQDMGLTEPKLTNETETQDCVNVDHSTKPQDCVDVDHSTKPQDVQRSDVLVDHVEELTGDEDATSENFIKIFDAPNSECHVLECKIKAEEEPESGTDAASDNLGETLDADHHMPQNRTKPEEPAGGKDATYLGENLDADHMPQKKTKPEEPAGGKDVTYLLDNVDALKYDYDMLESQIEAEDYGTQDLSKLEVFRVTESEDDGAATEPVIDLTNHVLLANHAKGPTEGEKRTTFENGTGAMDISRPEAMEAAEVEIDGDAGCVIENDGHILL